MLYTVKLKLQPTKEQSVLLLETIERFNAACNFISEFAFENKIFSKITLQKHIYYKIRNDFELSAQMAVRAIGKVAEAYKVKERRKTLNKFRPHGAMIYDQRILAIRKLDLVSLLTLRGRIEVPITVCGYHRQIMDNHRIRGQADLAYIDGNFYLFLVVETPDEPERISDENLGVDLGIVNIATTSDGEFFSGAMVKNIRRRNFRLRQKLQKKGTKSAKRLLKKCRKKEARFAKDVNHRISKQLVAIAKGTGRNLVLEDLTGIKKLAQKKREEGQKTVNRTMRQELSSWSFYQLRQFIEYKAKAAGVKITFVDPRNTSRTCPVCGCVDKANRKSQSEFVCVQCGHTANADINAAINIGRRGAVIRPNADATSKAA